MERRDFIVAGVAAGLGLAAGAAVTPRGCKLSGTPLDEMHNYLCAFHVEKDNNKNQVIAHHYCMEVNPEFYQCIVMDSNKKGAKLIGIEYVISERLYKELSETEQKLWHPHKYEVESGLLVAPNLFHMQEHTLMRTLRNTYGKTFHTWNDLQTKVPLGEPRLQWSFTEDGQLDPHLLARRDREMNVDTKDIKDRRTMQFGNKQKGPQWQK